MKRCLILLLFFFSVASAATDIGGRWEFAGYFCRSSTGQLHERYLKKKDLYIILHFNTESNTYNFEALWNYTPRDIIDSTCKVRGMGSYTVNDTTLDLQVLTDRTVHEVSGPFPVSCPPSRSGIGGTELSFDFFEGEEFTYFSFGRPCLINIELSGTNSIAIENGILYQAFKRPPSS